MTKRVRDSRIIRKGCQDSYFGFRRARQAAWIPGFPGRGGGRVDGKTKPDKLHVKPYQKSHGGPRKTRIKNVPDDTKKGIVEETKGLYVSKVGDLRTRWSELKATYYEIERDLKYCKRVWLDYLDEDGLMRCSKQALMGILDEADESTFRVQVSRKGMIVMVPLSMHRKLGGVA